MGKSQRWPLRAYDELYKDAAEDERVWALTTINDFAKDGDVDLATLLGLLNDALPLGPVLLTPQGVALIRDTQELMRSAIYNTEEEAKRQLPRLYTVLLGESADTRKSTALRVTDQFFRTLGAKYEPRVLWSRRSPSS